MTERLVETARLTLRLFALSDLDDVYSLLFADDEVAIAWTGRTWTLAEARGHRGFFTRVARGSDEPGEFAIERTHDGRLIGLVGVRSYGFGGADASLISPPDETDRIGAVPGRTEAEFTLALAGRTGVAATRPRAPAAPSGSPSTGSGSTAWSHR